MKPQPTPGPWTICLGDVVNSNHPEHLGERVADCDTSPVAARPCPASERDKANARLIAAAPDLLAALKDILHIATAASTGVTGNQPRLAKARAAIAKATGNEE